jgi:putative ATPase
VTATEPLASRLRPCQLADFVGQQHLLGPGKPLNTVLESGLAQSLLFWGPPGCGKTTLAFLLAKRMRAEIHVLSAVDSGAKDIRAVVDAARDRAGRGERTLLFIDEVHRFNKAQQDLFLPCVEDGTLVFIGATTENPAFSVNNALLSRVQVYALRQHTAEDLQQVIVRALQDKSSGLGALELHIDHDAHQQLVNACGGDIRRLLNWLEHCALTVHARGDTLITHDDVEALLAEQLHVTFDRGGDQFYDQISALHKAVRGSSVDAALYWLARMLTGGCDPLYIARRLLRMASEDVGNADPQALQVALSAWETQARLGQPEGDLVLAQAVSYLAMAPKSDAVYKAYKSARSAAQASGAEPVPLHLRNAPAKLLKKLGHGADYRYAHDYPNGYVPGESYLPEPLAGKCFYEPVARGFEREHQKRRAWFDSQDQASAWRRYETASKKQDD